MPRFKEVLGSKSSQAFFLHIKEKALKGQGPQERNAMMAITIQLSANGHAKKFQGIGKEDLARTSHSTKHKVQPSQPTKHTPPKANV